MYAVQKPRYNNLLKHSEVFTYYSLTSLSANLEEVAVSTNIVNFTRDLIKSGRRVTITTRYRCSRTREG